MFSFKTDAFVFAADATLFEASDPFAGEPQALPGDGSDVATGLPTGKRQIEEQGALAGDPALFEASDPFAGEPQALFELF
jgi:hypothetical protein